jgi:RND family efflux transporter MFP subunit
MKTITARASIHRFKKLLAIVALFFSVLPAMAQEQGIPLVNIARVQSWQQGASHTVHCKVQTSHIYQISSHSPARLKWILPEGTLVKKGQLLAEQDGYYLQQEIARLKIDIDSAKSEQDYTSSELERLSTLQQQQLISPSQLNNMQRQSRQAKLSKDRLANLLKEATYRLQNLQHYAQGAGQVLSMQTQPGEFLLEGQNILRLQPTENKELACALPLGMYRQSKQLNNAAYSLTNEQTLTRSRLSHSLDNDSQTLQLYLKSNDKNQTLLLGERIQVNINYQVSELTQVPHDALELAENAYFVWRLEDDNKVSRLPVTIVSTQNEHFLVRSSLLAGDTVVTIGKQGLSEQQQVNPSTDATGSEVSS